MYAVPNMAVFCGSFISYFPGVWLSYFLNDFEIVYLPLSLVFTFHMMSISGVGSVGLHLLIP